MLHLVLWVDDMLYGGPDKAMIKSFQARIGKRFKVTHQGEVHWLLGMEVSHDKAAGTIRVSQKKYISDMLTRFRMEDAYPAKNPSAAGQRDQAEQSVLLTAEGTHQFRSLIGSLMYAAVCTRPDITYHVIALARHMQEPAESHWNAAKRILRYLKGTRDQGLTYGKGSTDLIGYCDSDWAGDVATRRSTTGYCFLIAGAAVSWTSKLQNTVALSASEAEYMAASAAVQEAIYLRGVLKDIGEQSGPTVLREDNQGCIELVKNPVYHTRTKHIDVRYHFVRERFAGGEILMEYCPTRDQLADCLTKPLQGDPFVTCRAGIIGEP